MSAALSAPTSNSQNGTGGSHMATLNYLDMATVQARRCRGAPLPRSRSGYGSKLPTTHELRVNNRWHRVYAICWSNAATYYIVSKGERLYLATGEL